MKADLLEQTLSLARVELSPSATAKARGRTALGLAPPLQTLQPNAAVTRSWAALRASGKAGAFAGAVFMLTGFGAGYWLGLREVPAVAEPEVVSAVGVAPAHAAGTDSAALDAEARRAPPPDIQELSRSGSVGDEPGSDTARASAQKHRTDKATDVARSTSSHQVPERALTALPSVVSELSLLRRVEKAIRANDPALALALLDELDERFSETSLGEERLAARVIAHCGLNDAGARLRAENFLRQRPGSVYAERVRAACNVSAVDSPPKDRPRPETSDG